MIKDKRIFLTGGAGFIGTQICDKLYKENEILIYDNLKRNSIQYTDLLKEKNIKLVQGDVLEYSALKKCVDEFKPHIVIHLAAVAGIDTVVLSPVHTMKVNMIGTYHILEALVDHAATIERFIDFSTSEIFGAFAYKVDELSTTNLPPIGAARWTYAASKMAGEHLSYSYGKEYGFPVVSVRPFNVYGPRQVGEGAIHGFVEKAIRGEVIEIHGDGSQIRAWSYIEDFVEGILLCLEKQEAVGHAFNIADPQSTITIGMLAQMIKMVAGSKSEIIYVAKNYADVELRIPSIEIDTRILGYKPKISLLDGITKTIKWYRSVL